MITLLVGHRGTGKSSFLRGLRATGAVTYDLDEEIEKQTGRAIAALFSEGESHFRKIEREIFNRLMSEIETLAVVALGAGFEGPLPGNAHVIWLRRVSDSSGRVFLNRPRLNAKLSPIEEYKERFATRESRFQQWAHEELVLPEGYDGGLEDFLKPACAWSLPYDLTLLPENFRDWSAFWTKRQLWNLRRLELRDDLLSAEQVRLALKDIPRERVLFSLRRATSEPPVDVAVDWALELGAPQRKYEIVSVHERRETIKETFNDLNQYSARADILKAAVEIRDFRELSEGHAWWRQDPEHRAFLPRSTNGRWRWYRALFGRLMPLHFFREGAGSAADQPYLWETLFQPQLDTHFAAVLGQPIAHSRSPWENQKFFSDSRMPFVAIDVTENEFEDAIPLLREWGLKCTAVTSPLKKHAARLARSTEDSINTLYFDDHDQILSANTDTIALKKIAEELGPKQQVWLWGGGGVIPSVKAAWPQVQRFSARQGEAPAGAPDLFIWAVGRSRDFQFPPSHVRPRLILDLNYGEDSPGLEWAALQNHPYQSGLRMFKLQAEAQRAFWRERMRPS